MVSFNEISPTTRTPSVLLEFDASSAVQGAEGMPHKGLLVGQRRSGSVAALVPQRLQNASQAAAFWGVGSQLHQMALAWFANNTETEVWGIGLADPTGNAATGTITFTGSPTEAGTAAIYVAGERYAIAVAIAASVTALATSLAAAINADTNAPVTASPSAGVVTLTARHVGTMGNDIDLRHSYYDGETMPAGLTATMAAALSGGTGDPLVSGIWAPLGDMWLTEMVVPFTDATNLTSLEGELASRQTSQRKIGARAFACKTGSLSTVQTLGNGRNSYRSHIQGTDFSPTTPWEMAAMLAAQTAKSLAIDPARPTQFLPLIGMLAPAPKDRWTQAERNSNLFSGISTFIVAADGTCLIERTIATYKTNAFGGADSAWLDVNTSALADQWRYEYSALIGTKYPRHKVADDGTNFGPGQFILTPSGLRAETIGLALDWEFRGLLEDVDQFKRDLVCERNAQDPSRLDSVISPNFVNGLRVVAARLAFIV
jgi:phage tail sheath gpL-like